MQVSLNTKYQKKGKLGFSKMERLSKSRVPLKGSMVKGQNALDWMVVSRAVRERRLPGRKTSSKQEVLSKASITKEQNVLDWIVVSRAVRERELSKKFRLDIKSLREIINKLEKRGLVIRKRSLFGTIISFNQTSAEAKTEESQLLPSVVVVGKEKRFKTNLDVLSGLVNRFGQVELSKAAKFFKRNNDTVEGWAKILQSQGLIAIFYPLIGEPILLKRGESVGIVNSLLIKYGILLIIVLIVAYNIWT